MRIEGEYLWRERKVHNETKVAFLTRKWKNEVPHANEEKVRGVKYKDSDINVQVNDKNDEVLRYGEADLNNNMIQALTLNPKMMTYSKISKVDLEVEIEKGIVKQRYQFMKSVEEQDQTDESVDEHENEAFSLESKSIDYGKLRATDLPTNPRLIMPRPATIYIYK